MHLSELVEELAVQVPERDEHGAETGRYAPSLLRWLREARNGGTGRDGGGRSEKQRLTINAAALELWDQITAEIAAEYAAATTLTPNPVAPGPNLMAAYVVFRAAADRGETTPDQHAVFAEKLQRWHDRIRAHFDGPKVLELMVACPVCGEDRVVTGAGEMEVEHQAVTARLVGAELHAGCALCGAEWRGQPELMSLSRQLGFDMEAIADRIRALYAPETTGDAA